MKCTVCAKFQSQTKSGRPLKPVKERRKLEAISGWISCWQCNLHTYIHRHIFNDTYLLILLRYLFWAADSSKGPRKKGEGGGGYVMPFQIFPRPFCQHAHSFNEKKACCRCPHLSCELSVAVPGPSTSTPQQTNRQTAEVQKTSPVQLPHQHQSTHKLKKNWLTVPRLLVSWNSHQFAVQLQIDFLTSEEEEELEKPTTPTWQDSVKFS